MELTEFIEKFLPDYKGKWEAWRNLYKDRPMTASMHEFHAFYFTEAFQNFTNLICEKQRDKCCESFEDSRSEWNDFENDDMQESYYQISKTDQPKIEEL